MNTLVIIGYIGSKSCYLNVPKEEALKRYCKEQNIDLEEMDERAFIITMFQFEDEFQAYDVWEIV